MNETIHIVYDRDTMTSIARRFFTTADGLLNCNEFSDSVFPGEMIGIR